MFDTVLIGSLGALTDLRAQERAAFNRAFAARRMATRWDAADYARILRAGRFSGVLGALSDMPEAARPAFLAEVEHHFRDLIDETTPALAPWTADLIRDARRAGLRLALVAGAERQTALRVLAALFGTRASVVFDLVTTPGPTTRPKPAPDLYADALAALHRTPDRALAFETTRDGLRAARAAGLPVFPAIARTQAVEDFSDATGPRPETLRDARLAARAPAPARLCAE
jgi:HAD superfamily hydrolase (TIGR01509 family)